MKPGDIVVCTDARLTDGRLKEGWRYVVEHVWENGDIKPNGLKHSGETSFGLFGCGNTIHSKPLNYGWKSSRFRPLERKEIKDKVNSVIADKILGVTK